MKDLVDNVIEVDFDEIETYSFPLDELFGLEINHEDVKYCFIIRFSSTNKNLICMAPAAQLRDARTSQGKLITPPYFNRWSWYSRFEESFIAYADPTYFYDGQIRIGWFVGTERTWYLEVVAEIFRRIARNQKIINSNMLFYGSSAGGFASIALGTLIKGTKVLVNNAQFNIMNYNDDHIENLFRVLRKEFPDLSDTQIEEKLKVRLKIIELIKKEGYVPHISYYLNSISDPDFNNQFLPFIDELKGIEQFDNEFVVHFYRNVKDKPHNPLPINESVKILKEYMSQYLYNEEESSDNKLVSTFAKRNSRLAEENERLASKSKALEEENCSIKRQIDSCKSKVASLEEENRSYRMQIDSMNPARKVKNFIKSMKK